MLGGDARPYGPDCAGAVRRVTAFTNCGRLRGAPVLRRQRVHPVLVAPSAIAGGTSDLRSTSFSVASSASLRPSGSPLLSTCGGTAPARSTLGAPRLRLARRAGHGVLHPGLGSDHDQQRRARRLVDCRRGELLICLFRSLFERLAGPAAVLVVLRRVRCRPGGRQRRHASRVSAAVAADEQVPGGPDAHAVAALAAAGVRRWVRLVLRGRSAAHLTKSDDRAGGVSDPPPPALLALATAALLALAVHGAAVDVLGQRVRDSVRPHSPSGRRRLLVNAVTRNLGDISYSGYLVHFAVLDLAARRRTPRRPDSPDSHSHIWRCCMRRWCSASVVTATLTHRLIEDPAPGPVGA